MADDDDYRAARESKFKRGTSTPWPRCVRYVPDT